MKSAIILTLTTLTAVAFSAAVDHHTILARLSASDYVFKDPESYTVKCKVVAGGNGTCSTGKSSLGNAIDIPCINSRCDNNGDSCTVAYGETSQEAKCPTNLLSYDWAWPWIDVDAKAKINAAGARRAAVDACIKINSGNLDGKGTEANKIEIAEDVFQCYNSQVVAPVGKKGDDAENNAKSTIKSVNACVKTADEMWSKSKTDTDRKNAAVALVACYDTVQWT